MRDSSLPRFAARIGLVASDVAFPLVIALVLTLGFASPAYAYVDPSVMTYTIQALAASRWRFRLCSASFGAACADIFCIFCASTRTRENRLKARYTRSIRLRSITETASIGRNRKRAG